MSEKKPKPRVRRPKTDPSPYPKGWNRRRIRALIDHYENQSDEDAIAEAEAAYLRHDQTIMSVPVDLVPQVQKLIARRRAG